MSALQEAQGLVTELAEGGQQNQPMEVDDAAAVQAALLRLQAEQEAKKRQGMQVERKSRDIAPAMEGFLRAQQKPKTWFRRDVAGTKAKRPRSPSADAVLAALVRAGKLTPGEAEQVLRSTPRTKGKYFQRIKGTPESERVREKALASRFLDRNNFVDELQDLAGPERDNIREENKRVKAIRSPKERRNATRALYGGAPLSHLLTGQRGYLSKKILDKRSVDPAVAVQLFARQDGGIASATRCAAAVEAARLASRGTYGSNTAKYTQQAIINDQRAKRAKAATMSEQQRASIYRGLKKLDDKGLPKSRIPRTTTFINKLRGLNVDEDELQRIQTSQPSPKKQYERYVVPARQQGTAEERRLRALEVLQQRLLAEGQRLNAEMMNEAPRGVPWRPAQA